MVGWGGVQGDERDHFGNQSLMFKPGLMTEFRPAVDQTKCVKGSELSELMFASG